MRFFLIRHGEAQDISAKYADEDRPLTSHGKAQAKAVGRFLSEGNERPTVLWASPYARAQETSELIRSALGLPSVHTKQFLLPHISPERVISEVLASDEEKLAVVSHQPLVGNILSFLLGEKADEIPMNTATLVELEFTCSKSALVPEDIKLSRVTHTREIM